MEFFKIRRTIPFMRHAVIFNIISILTFLIAVGSLATKGLNFSIEFTGGTVMELQYPGTAEVEDIRSTLARAGYQDSQVQNFGTSRDVLIRIPVKRDEQAARVAENAMFALASAKFRGRVDDKTSNEQTQVEIAFKQPKTLQHVRDLVANLELAQAAVTQRGDAFAITVPRQRTEKSTPQLVAERIKRTLIIDDYEGKVRRVEFVGPQVGKELAEYGALALLVTAFGIVAYLALRFEWKFGVAGIIANLHDVVIILGFFSFFQWEFSLPVLAAVLAILGYSVNESVVIFDRVREDFRKMRRATTVEILDHAITANISRTIITHGSTQIMALTMLLFGGPALHYFAVALTIGICFGIYSSVFVAAALLMWFKVNRAHFIKPPRKGGRDEHEGAVV